MDFAERRPAPGGPPSQRSGSALNRFFTLPTNIRQDIYRRVLVVGYPLLLFQQKGSQVVETFSPDKPVRWLALLRTNHQVHGEASLVLYGSNCFTFMDTTRHQAGLIQSFLNCVGSVNAGLLSHLCINFPALESLEGQPGKVIVGGDDLHSLKLLQEKCTSLTTLETLVYSQISRDLVNISRDGSQLIRETLLQIDAELRAIPSLKKIVVRHYDGTPTPSVMELMEGLGWLTLPGRYQHKQQGRRKQILAAMP